MCQSCGPSLCIVYMIVIVNLQHDVDYQLRELEREARETFTYPSWHTFTDCKFIANIKYKSSLSLSHRLLSILHAHWRGVAYLFLSTKFYLFFEPKIVLIQFLIYEELKMLRRSSITGSITKPTGKARCSRHGGFCSCEAKYCTSPWTLMSKGS